MAVVEDNTDLRDEIVFHLQRHGHHVVGLPDGVALDAHLATEPLDVLVLDLGLPGEDGLSIAARLRAHHPDIAIAMLTARGELDDRLRGFKNGADIYLVKPVDMRELSAVAESLHRRVRGAERPPPRAEWRLDSFTMELASPGGESVMLTPTECNLVRALADAAPEAVPRTVLAAAMGHAEPDFDYRRLETSLSRLRRKIECRCADTASPLRSARNVGYVFAAPIRVLSKR
ncbi:MAG: response regulator transcription factor [Comamonadaceae bacterium]|nr:response regulator transcription factor [Comamonadaceae bacterium]